MTYGPPEWGDATNEKPSPNEPAEPSAARGRLSTVVATIALVCGSFAMADVAAQSYYLAKGQYFARITRDTGAWVGLWAFYAMSSVLVLAGGIVMLRSWPRGRFLIEAGAALIVLGQLAGYVLLPLTDRGNAFNFVEEITSVTTWISICAAVLLLLVFQATVREPASQSALSPDQSN